MVEYDKKVLCEYGERLYAKAGSIAFTYTVIGALLGGSTYMANHGAGIVLAVIGGVIGFFIGNEKGFWYRLQAQQALCQMKIEENTASHGVTGSYITDTPLSAKIGSVTVPAQAPPPSDEGAMRVYGITFDNGKYYYAGYSYDNLSSAIAYAKLCTERGATSVK